MMGSADSPVRGRHPPPSDLGSDQSSERRKDMRFEGVEFLDRMDKGVVSKHSNSDFTYAGNDEFHSVKIYQGGSGGEQSRRTNNEETFYRSKALKQSSLSQSVLPNQTCSNTDEYSSIWDQDQAVAVNVPGNVQYPTYVSPFRRQVHPFTFRDAAAGPSVTSHVAADEGSRNGMNESGVRNLMRPGIVSDKINPNSGGHVSELSGAFVAGMKLKTGVHFLEPDSPIPGRTKASYSSQQMTIFYDGHAYVFQDVHPYKAEIIMAMAASNATTCSSTLSAKSSMRQIKESFATTGEIETATASNPDLARNQRGKSSTAVNTSLHEYRSGEQISRLAGSDQESKGVI